MKTLIINPNSSDSVTELIRQEAVRYAGADTQIDVMTSVHGPVTIESEKDEIEASYHVLNELKHRENEYDGMIIACASDPGLYAARELLQIPVTGIFEAGIYMCNIKGRRVGIFTSCGAEEIPGFRFKVDQYGFQNKLACIIPLGLGVLGVSMDQLEYVESEILKAKEMYGIDTALLACAAFAGMGRRLTETCEIYVSDGIAESVCMIRALFELSQYR